MFYCHKLIIFCTVLFVNFPLFSQYLAQPFCEGVHMYLKSIEGQKEFDKKGIHAQLIISNQNKNELIIKDFCNTIFHQGDHQFKTKEQNCFFWKLLSINNTEVENKVFIFPQIPKHSSPEKDKVNKSNIDIDSQSFSVVRIDLHYSLFVHYPNGIYKLCLYYNDKCVAEMPIELK